MPDAGKGAPEIRIELDVEVPVRDGAVPPRQRLSSRHRLSLPRPADANPLRENRTAGSNRWCGPATRWPPRTAGAAYASGGEYVPFTVERTQDGEDGYDSVEWLASQPWCNGKVGTFGGSYNAWMQWSLARLRPPHLVAMCAWSIPLEITELDWWGSFRPGRRVKWWMTNMAPDLRRRHGLPPPHTPEQAEKIWDHQDRMRWIWFLPWMDLPKYLPPGIREHASDWFRNSARRCWRFDPGPPRGGGPQPGLQRLVRPLQRLRGSPSTDAEARPHGEGAGTDPAHHRPLEPQAPGRARPRLHRLRTRGPGRPDPGDDSLVRPLAQGRRRRTAAGTAGAVLRHGIGGLERGPDLAPTGWHRPGASSIWTARAMPMVRTAQADCWPRLRRGPVKTPTTTIPGIRSRHSGTRRCSRNPPTGPPSSHRRDILNYRTDPLEKDEEVTGCPEAVLFASTSARDTGLLPPAGGRTSRRPGPGRRLRHGSRPAPDLHGSGGPGDSGRDCRVSIPSAWDRPPAGFSKDIESGWRSPAATSRTTIGTTTPEGTTWPRPNW